MINSLNLNDFFMNKLILIPGLLIAITFHEIAHGMSAYMLGDSTAKKAGRLSLNPLVHIDLLGFILLFTVGFGWAKPVPINSFFFKNRKKDTFIVSLAGPLTNILLALISTVITAILIKLNTNFILIIISRYIIRFNIVLGIFNLLPFPPLDGSKIVASLLPVKYEIRFYKYEKYLYIVLIILVVTNTINKILGPLVLIADNILAKLVMHLLNIL